MMGMINYILIPLLKSKHKMKKIVIIFFLIQLIGCDLGTRKLKIVNESNKTIYCSMRCDTNLNSHLSQSLYEIFPKDHVFPSIGAGLSGEVWEYTINNCSIDSTLHLFFFETNQISDSIIKNHKYMKLDLKVKDLDSLKWELYYE
jgi:hypothetical protein